MERWEVVEGFGSENQRVIAEVGSFKEAFFFVEDRYEREELDKLRVDILRNGSIDY